MRDFVAAWDKVMNLDRFDLVAQGHGVRPPVGAAARQRLNPAGDERSIPMSSSHRRLAPGRPTPGTTRRRGNRDKADNLIGYVSAVEGAVS